MDRWMQCWLAWTVALLRWHYMTRNADRLRLRWFFGCQMTPWIGVAFVGYVHLHAFTIVYQYCAGTSHNGLVPTVRKWQDMHHGGHVSYRHAAWRLRWKHDSGWEATSSWCLADWHRPGGLNGSFKHQGDGDISHMPWPWHGRELEITRRSTGVHGPSCRPGE